MISVAPSGSNGKTFTTVPTTANGTTSAAAASGGIRRFHAK
ncbi:Uncharacterised protein [Mycobacteroides abscessus subsp. abscessus]|nr:Uncharacterised protein [Mycobacteroides abscessus subsp. abscessus]